MNAVENLIDEKSIFVLKASSRSIMNAETFLTTRGWRVSSSLDLLETITMLVDQQPRFFLLCCDHPSAKALQLPKILSKCGLKIITVLFVDRESSVSVSRMHSLKHPHHILPPVSGPSIERAILKIQKEIEHQQRIEAKLGNREKERVAVSEDLKRAVQLYFSSGDDSETEIDPAIFEGVSSSDGVTTSSPSAPQTKEALKQAPLPSNASSKNKDPEKNIDPNKKESAAKQKNNDLKKDSIMVKGTEMALDIAANSQPSQKIQKIEASSNCVCITIESTRFNGYLVAAMGRNRVLDADFVANVQKRLFDFLRQQGENVSDDDGCEVKLKQVEFEDWALEQADFLKKSIHNGNEVAMAFFPTEKATPEILGSEAENMVQMSIDDIEGDKEVNFNVYIYLPTNHKYVLMTPKGGVFLGVQKERLKKKGVSQMHMRKDEVKDVKQYKAQNYLNNKIDEFHQKRREQVPTAPPTDTTPSQAEEKTKGTKKTG